jgi:RNA polymerase sigma-70 factor (ECF subfamily)
VFYVAKRRGDNSVQTQRQRNREDPEPADSFLVQQSLSGDQEAFEVLVSRYKHSLFVLIHHYVGEYHEAEDILQQVLLQLYLSLATLRPNAYIKPWLFTVARNRSLDALRHKRLHSQRLLPFSEVKPGNEEDEVAFLDTIPDTSPTPEELVEQHELQHEIWRAIQSLPHTYRSIFVLYYGEQLNYAEIGRILNKPGTTVKTQFNRAKPFMQAVLIAH